MFDEATESDPESAQGEEARLVAAEVLKDPKKAAVLVQIAAQLNTFHGALPHPDVLERYEMLVPGATARLLAMVEKQADHRMAMESQVVGHEVQRSQWGVIGAIVVTLSFEAICALMVAKGYIGVGAILGGGWLAGLAGIFMYGSRSRRQERETKAKIMSGQLPLPLEQTESGQ